MSLGHLADPLGGDGIDRVPKFLFKLVHDFLVRPAWGGEVPQLAVDELRAHAFGPSGSAQ